MDEKLEITLRITLDRSGLERERHVEVPKEIAFNILGRVHAQLTDEFGDEHCLVEMDAATGLNPHLVRSMNSFAPRHKRALEALYNEGEALVADRDIVEVFAAMHDVIITPIGSRWRISQVSPVVDSHPGSRRRAPKN